MIGERDTVVFGKLLELFDGKPLSDEIFDIRAVDLISDSPAEMWPAVNQLAAETPGALAYLALSGSTVPDSFRVLAPSFEESRWHTVATDGAVARLTGLLQTGLGDNRRRSEVSASRIATAFVNCFGRHGMFISNQDPQPAQSNVIRSTGSWAVAAPLTAAYAEDGVVAYGGGRIGVLWFVDNL